MANPAKAKGTLFETAVERYLKDAGLRAYKPRQTGRYDIGDIHLEDDIILQAKAWANIATALVAGVKGATAQAGHAKREYGIAVIKKPRGAIADAYVVMPLHTFVKFVKRPPTD